ncbi:hypothetical protein ACVWYN_000982 [Pedobacter sp. UYP24]
MSDCNEKQKHLNQELLSKAAQDYINTHLQDDVNKIALAKSPINGIESAELSNQISAKKKSAKKLPTWFNNAGIYYPSPLSIEQTSSETTAKYKSGLAKGKTLLDVTGGFGVDGYFFASEIESTVHCEINEELLEITSHNASILKQENTIFMPIDGIEFLKENPKYFDTIYIDPARRSTSGKVFFLKECNPDVVTNLDLLLGSAGRLIIKTSPLLDISAGLLELKNIVEIHIVSVKNECKELLWVLEDKHIGPVKVVAITLNEAQKSFSFTFGDQPQTQILETTPIGYLYEPDVALLKSGAFNLIAERYNIKKLDIQTQLYSGVTANHEFPGRIFKINRILTSGSFKKEKDLKGNVIVRNYRDKAESIIKRYKIKSDLTKFLIFTYSKKDGFIVIEADIIQHY